MELVVLVGLTASRERALGAGADEQRRLEPSAMLVVPFDVEIRGPRQLRTLLQHRELRAAGVEPDVEDVALLAERRIAAGAGEIGRNELADVVLVPGVG